MSSFEDEIDGCLEIIDEKKIAYATQSVASSTIRLQIFLALVKKIGANVTHINAYGSAVHQAMHLQETTEPFIAKSTLVSDAPIRMLPHPSRCVNHANIGVFVR